MLVWVGELWVEMVGDRAVHLVRLKWLLAGLLEEGEGRLREVLSGGGCGSCAEVGRWGLSAVGGGLGQRKR